jgi:hypothetical protein
MPEYGFENDPEIADGVAAGGVRDGFFDAVKMLFGGCVHRSVDEEDT